MAVLLLVSEIFYIDLICYFTYLLSSIRIKTLAKLVKTSIGIKTLAKYN